MSISMPKLIVFDLDGTLAESKQRVQADMGELFSQLLKKIPVAVMSGAGFTQFETQFFPALPADTHLERLYIFPDNAAQCFLHVNGAWRPQYDNQFAQSERDRITGEIEAALQEGLLELPPKIWGAQIEDRGAEITFSALGQEAPLEEKEKWDRTREKRRPLYEALLKRLPEFSVALNATTSIDITRKGINKAYGIKRLVELTGISLAEMLYVGDALDEGGNDAVVIGTGVRTHAVFGPRETAALIETLLQSRNH